jgi:hypothetical protein
VSYTDACIGEQRAARTPRAQPRRFAMFPWP